MYNTTLRNEKDVKFDVCARTYALSELQTVPTSVPVQQGAHAIARARTSTHVDLRALLTTHSAHARNSAPTDRAPEATTQAHKVYRSSKQPPPVSPACACSLAWPLAGRRGSPLPLLDTLAATQRPSKKVTSTLTSASPRDQRSRFSRKSCRRVERSSPSMSKTAASASWSAR